MPGQRGPGRRHLALPDDRLRPRVPVPQQHRAVGRAGRDVTVGRDVALGPRQARHHAVMAEHDLDDLGALRREHPEAVVPEAAGQQEPAVDRRHEAVGAYLQVLAEVVAEVAALRRVCAAVRLR